LKRSARSDPKRIFAEPSSPFARIPEVLGLRIAGQDLGKSDAPMQVLAGVGGRSSAALLIDMGVWISHVAERWLASRQRRGSCLLMAHTMDLHLNHYRATQTVQNKTPGRGHRNCRRGPPRAPSPCRVARSQRTEYTGLDGSLATYGFIVTYALVCVALPRYLRKKV